MQATHLLVVEDEDLLHMALEAALWEAGFHPVIEHNGADAVERLRREPDKFAGVITDIRLGPGPDGWEVARVARGVNPTMPVVYASGDSAAEWPVEGVPNSIMLQKPFAMAQLVTAISQLLNSVSAAP